ncbi:DUF5133 domain-containing protein [Streptomyces sp. NPDC090306]|uniref:DUF5133 domain-containing protein n=1 Tax=Streptomyces sp. NPDC090306 TaxID=3365961 RepID=UPI0037F12D2D
MPQEADVLTPRPDVLSELISRYNALGAAQAGPETARAREDAAYTLCVLTGTRDIGAALARARRLLATTAPDTQRTGAPAPFVVVSTGAAAPEDTVVTV